jgi:hypothetical protein
MTQYQVLSHRRGTTLATRSLTYLGTRQALLNYGAYDLPIQI